MDRKIEVAGAVDTILNDHTNILIIVRVIKVEEAARSEAGVEVAAMISRSGTNAQYRDAV